MAGGSTPLSSRNGYHFMAVLPAVALRVVSALAVLWAASALWFDAPTPRWTAHALAGACLVAGLALLAGIRSVGRAVGLVALLVGMVAIGWLSLAPRQDRDWSPDVLHPATAAREGSRVTIGNVRDFVYRSENDFDPVWETRSYDLDDVVGVDLFISYWGPTAYAHTTASWEFADGRHLAISIETRKERGEAYSAVRGLFRQYELFYVVADERDVLGLRAAQRGEQVFLYRTAATPKAARGVLESYLERVNELAQAPAWYNALTHNCTTLIRGHVARVVAGGAAWDWRILANGYLDRLAYERGTINTNLPFEELRRRSDVTAEARAAAGDPAFSRLIRAGLPERPRR